jgi:hypothetical protein
MTAVDGVILLGSFAAGSVDELSDVDVWVVATPGRSDDAWRGRRRLARNAFATWEVESRGSFKWLTRDLVKVDCRFVDPVDATIELAEPHAVLVGEESLTAVFVTVSREVVEGRVAERTERQRVVDADAMTDGETADWAFSELKNAARRLRRT